MIHLTECGRRLAENCFKRVRVFHSDAQGSFPGSAGVAVEV